MLKYLGSKQKLLGEITRRYEKGLALDLFCGSCRVGRALQSVGAPVVVNDWNALPHLLGKVHVEYAPHDVEFATLHLAALRELPGAPGFLTRTYGTEGVTSPRRMPRGQTPLAYAEAAGPYERLSAGGGHRPRPSRPHLWDQEAFLSAAAQVVG